ncbi:MAG: hypothetical protein LQ350_005261 [Teloschistes chrysophthalmus]|nr:MAG: hypothetical protein LQ350_005261 [Niorma chrysophthalma]
MYERFDAEDGVSKIRLDDHSALGIIRAKTEDRLRRQDTKDLLDDAGLSIATDNVNTFPPAHCDSLDEMQPTRSNSAAPRQVAQAHRDATTISFNLSAQPILRLLLQAFRNKWAARAIWAEHFQRKTHASRTDSGFTAPEWHWSHCTTGYQETLIATMGDKWKAEKRSSHQEAMQAGHAPAQAISAEAKREAAQQRFHQHDEGIKNRMQEDHEGFQAQQRELLKVSRDKITYDGTRITEQPDS